MNNDQFRKLAFGSGASSGSNVGSSNGAPKALGSRQKASIPMTPRHGDVSRVAFARQMAERFGGSDAPDQTNQKPKFRTSRPRGTKFAEGYVDRAKLRAENDAGDDTTTKGLDFAMLHRVKEGGEDGGEDGEGDKEEDGPDVDDEFERMEGAAVHAVEREKTTKKGQYSTAAPAAGQKRSRDQILAEMKAARDAAKQAKAAAAEPALGSRFKKIGAPQQAGSRIEIDSRGREVLILVDEDGHEKRKVRKAPSRTTDEIQSSGPALGMEVPEYYRKKQEAEAAAAAAKEVDIFDGVGSDYDPLAGMDESEEEDDEDDDKQTENKEAQQGHDSKRRRRPTSRDDGEASDASDAPRRDSRRSPKEEERKRPSDAPRKNYFGNVTLLSETTSRGGPSLNDPSVLAALRKAKQMREATESEEKAQVLSKEAEREARLKKLLQSSERDAEDLDMGFGTNRVDDTEDLEGEDGKKVRLSKWKGGAAADDGGEAQEKKQKKGKKRKGDGNNADDVMRVLERRKEGRP